MAKKANEKKNWFVRHKVWTAIFVVIGLIIVSSALSGNETTTQKSDQNATVQDAQNSGQSEQVAKIGQSVRDGKFEFKVAKVKCGEKKVGDEFLNEKAQGQFCRLSLSIKNIGNEPQSLFSDNQKLIDEQGREYAANSTATIYASSDSGSTWFDEINPGNSVKGDILFDVPKSAKIKYAQLHDSAFSGGVQIQL